MFNLSQIKWGSGSTEQGEQTENAPAQEQEERNEEPQNPEVEAQAAARTESGVESNGEDPAQPAQPEQSASEEIPEWKAKFEKPEDLWAAYNELANREPEVKEIEKIVEKPKEIEDELLKGLVEYYEQGGDLAKYLEAKVVNYDTFSDQDILRMEFEKKYPDLGKQEVGRLFQRHLERNYMSENPETSEMELDELQLKADASTARRTLKDEQSKFKLPEPKQVATKQGPTQEELDAFAKEQQALEAMLKPVLKKYGESKKITVKYGESDPGLNYELKDWDVIEDIAANDQKFFSLFATGDESNPVDFDKWIEVIAFAKDPEGYKKSLIGYGKNLGTEGVVNEITNPGAPNAKPPSAGPSSLFDAMKAAIEAHNRK